MVLFLLMIVLTFDSNVCKYYVPIQFIYILVGQWLTDAELQITDIRQTCLTVFLLVTR